MMENAIAIITARGGSKRIPGKNIRDFCGSPIITYSVRAAVESGLFDEVMVSTDSEEIAETAVKAGAVCPFMRSAETAGDFATTQDVIKEVLTRYREMGRTFRRYCVLYPTAPFVTGEKLREAARVLDESGADFLTPVVRYGYPVQRCFVIEDGRLKRKWPEYQNVRSQDLEPLYFDPGQFYFGDAELVFTVPYAERNMAALEIPEDEAQDIDTPEDWKKAEEKYLAMMKRE